MTDKPAVLVANKHLGPLAAVLGHLYTVYCLWDAPPVEAEQDVRVIITAGDFPLDPQILDRLPNLGLIACFTVGYEGVDVEDARRRGLQMSYAPGANHEDVADHALALLLAERRQVVSGDRRVRAGEWAVSDKPLTRSLRGETVGVVGLGRIGVAVAERCEAFGMAVRWWGPTAKPEARWPRAASLLTLARDSDVLVICAKLDDDSRGSVDAQVLEALGPRGLLINVARGGLVDEAALLAALTSGKLGGAALDVFSEEPTSPGRWADLPHVIVTPHSGGATDKAVQSMVAMLMENLALFFADEPVKTPIVD